MSIEKINVEKQYEQYIEKIKNLRLIDDDFMSKVFEDKECTKVLLRAILKKKDLKVKAVKTQYDIHNLQGRSVRLDVIAEDESGQIFDIEIQRSNKGATPKRARYNSSIIDANITNPGDDYKNLKETYVIFITEKYVFDAGKLLYHIDRIIKETKKHFGDDAHIIYVNSQIQNNTSLGKIMRDFYCTNPNDIKNRILKKRVKFFKESQKGVDIMCSAFEEVMLEGEKRKAKEGAKNLLKLGKLTDKEIANSLGLSVHEVTLIKEEEENNLKAV